MSRPYDRLMHAVGLVRELQRMRWHVARIDEDFDSLVVLFRRRTPLTVEIGTGSHAQDAFELADGTIVVHTTWRVSARERFRRRLGEDLMAWVYEHDDPRGVAAVRAAQLEIVLAASTYGEALNLLGGDVTWLSVPDALAETQGDAE
jgi:hypothetical protein